MKFLSETCPVFEITQGGWTSTYQHDEVDWDDDEGFYYSCDSGRVVKAASDRPARWWSVALYTSSQAYGGPEEGGWWYSRGSLIEPWKIKFFDNYQDAEKYRDELWEYCEKENKDLCDERVTVRCFTEEMPDHYFPKTRPHYS